MTAAIGSAHASYTDDDLHRISLDNPGWRFERTDDGRLLVSPTSTPRGAKSAEALVQLALFARVAGGKVFDSSTGFKTPAGGVVSPDAAWIAADRLTAFARDDGYWQIMPDVVIEVASRTDVWQALVEKIDKYHTDGALYALAVDPATGATYERGDPPAALRIDVAAISAA